MSEASPSCCKNQLRLRRRKIQLQILALERLLHHREERLQLPAVQRLDLVQHRLGELMGEGLTIGLPE